MGPRAAPAPHCSAAPGVTRVGRRRGWSRGWCARCRAGPPPAGLVPPQPALARLVLVRSVLVRSVLVRLVLVRLVLVRLVRSQLAREVAGPPAGALPARGLAAAPQARTATAVVAVTGAAAALLRDRLVRAGAAPGGATPAAAGRTARPPKGNAVGSPAARPARRWNVRPALRPVRPGQGPPRWVGPLRPPARLPANARRPYQPLLVGPTRRGRPWHRPPNRPADQPDQALDQPPDQAAGHQAAGHQAAGHQGSAHPAAGHPRGVRRHSGPGRCRRAGPLPGRWRPAGR
jgi:hypothetical protein